MNTSRLRWYIFLSILFHLLVLWLLRFLPPYEPPIRSPVAIRMLDTPVPSTPLPQNAKSPEQQQQNSPPKPARPQKGGILAELPKPEQEERPEEARIVSQYDSRAQDIGPGEAAARKPSGAQPPNLPPELDLPERYSRLRPTPPQELRTPPIPPAPAPQLQARELSPPVPETKPKTLPPAETLEKPDKDRGKALAPPAPLPELRRFHITDKQELAMLQRERELKEKTRGQTMEEHFASLENHQPLPSFDAPGTYERGPEQPGEGQRAEGGGKYRSIDSFGLKHFSYLVGVKRQIELVFSVPFFAPNQGVIGVPIVGFTIRRNGELAEAILLRSSGYSVLDKALLEAVKRAAPYGPFPNHLPDAEISIRVFATVS